ncbi:hypothetical protein O9K51_03413 [Purpureocillium lavendulum]|uniref:Uncharacterized protein n=1 Tax=Purpureocillium lavendulum TaxID=1247861 RepID=A0AB34G2B5_9HYPO|nr:hypothetical protein O9K51_03413 [Purpureocillium lavendulum]
MREPVPRCADEMPVLDVDTLLRELQYRPLSYDFYIPVPTQRIIAALIDAEPDRLALGPSRDPSTRTEHKMAGLIHGVLLRHLLAREMQALLTKYNAARWRRGAPAREPDAAWRRRCEDWVSLLERDVRDLEVEYIYHWFDLRSSEYMTRLKAEVEEGWEMHAGYGSGKWTNRDVAPVVKRRKGDGDGRRG